MRLGEIGLENEQYSSAVGDLLECQILQKARFEKLDRRIAETHYHLGIEFLRTILIFFGVKKIKL